MGFSLYNMKHFEHLLLPIVVALVLVAVYCQLRRGTSTLGNQSNNCKHYRNRCRIRFRCCKKLFDCWECHYEQRAAGHHNLNYVDYFMVKVICSRCDREQEVKEVCENEECNARMADYYCTNCKKLYNVHSIYERPSICTGCAQNMFISNEEFSAYSASSFYLTTISSEYYSLRIASIMKESMKNVETNMVESKITASKDTWTEMGTSKSVVEELEFFKNLRIMWPYFFRNETINVGAKIAEGGQADIFEVNGDSNKVIKMFKKGWRLIDLEKRFPRVILNFGIDYAVLDPIDSFGGDCCNIIDRGIFLDGRLALVMLRMWGDLRTVIDARMIYNKMQAPPFSKNVSALCMFQIALGMSYLHRINILHRDLKTTNVLILGCGKKSMMGKKLPLDGEFKCYVADFESSIGVAGTGFYRAPEILHALKNSENTTLPSELFNKASDVYSYGMTCYEILTGRIPFEELQRKDFDKVIGGYRPKLPSRVPHWMKELLTKCWHNDPCKRPTFDEIVWLLKDGISKGSV